MREPRRREFLRAAGLAAGAGLLVDPGARARSVEDSERIGVAVMGVRGRGKALAASFAEHPRARVVRLCDVDESVLGEVVKLVADRQGSQPAVDRDFRRTLEDPAVDALVVATPDHWHAPATVAACRAGKHVYVEKPASQRLAEGRAMIEAARRAGKVVQVGTQSRSAPHYLEAIKLLREGRIGRLLVAKAWNSQRRPDISPAEDGPAPEGVDYDLWLGPASLRDFNPNRFHYTWHWTWEFGTGDMGNDGVHDLDIARWGLGVGLPRNVQCAATRAVNRNWETPDTVYATFQFPETEAMLVFEQRDWSPYLQEGLENGVAFHGTEGYMLLGRAGWRLFEGNREVETSAASFSDRPHFDNFLEAIRTGRRPNADIEEGHRSAALVHLANIAHRVDRPITFDVATESIVGDEEANGLASRTYREPFGIGITT